MASTFAIEARSEADPNLGLRHYRDNLGLFHMSSFFAMLITKFYRIKHFLDVLLITKAGLIGSCIQFHSSGARRNSCAGPVPPPIIREAPVQSGRTFRCALSLA